MLVTLGWMLLAGSPLPRAATPLDLPLSPAHQPVRRTGAGRVSVRTDRDDPYDPGDRARVYLSVEEPAHVAVFRVDTDGRIRVLFPREPWSDTFVRDEREVEVTGERGGRAFFVDDDPGVGYLFAISAAEPLDLRSITRGDSWDYRLIDGGRIQGDPYVALTDLAARLVPNDDYDYDVSPYYVEHRYDFPRFVCYDCHAYAQFDEWNPYRASCTRYQVVIRDDPRFYPYRYGGRNVVADRPIHPGPRYIFRDVDPRRPPASRNQSDRRRDVDEESIGRTSRDVGGRGSVPAPGVQSLRRRDGEPAPELSPARPLNEERRRAERRRQDGDREPPRRRARGESADEASDGRQPGTGEPQSTGEPELRRRPPTTAR